VKNTLRIAFAFFLFLLLSVGGLTSAGNQPPLEGDVLPEIALTSPKSPTDQKYLGISGEATFTIPEIKAEVVIIEIFSMFWPFCQREAPSVNEIYRLIENDEKLKSRVKLIGIGVGNSEFEVEYFKKTFNIPFPLFPDEDFLIHKKLGEVMTPCFIGVRIMDDGTHKIFFSEVARTGDAGKVLKELLKEAALSGWPSTIKLLGAAQSGTWQRDGALFHRDS
jgi:peroxiredoxin